MLYDSIRRDVNHFCGSGCECAHVCADGRPSFCRHGFTPDVPGVNDGGAAELVQGGVSRFRSTSHQKRHEGAKLSDNSVSNSKS